MSFFERLPVGELSVTNRSLAAGAAVIIAGTATTRAAVLAQLPDDAGIGSLYLSSAGKIYLRVAAAGAAADIELVTTSAAD